MRCRVPLVLCALVVAVVFVGAAPVGGQSDVTETQMGVQITGDGDARWTIVAIVPIEDETERSAFESFAADFEAGSADVDLGIGAFEAAAAEASIASGREMSIHSERRDSVIVETTDDEGETVTRGELQLSFTWGSFARPGDDGVLVVDDAFNTTNGTWLPGLDEGQSLTIYAPSGYSVTSAPIGPSAGELYWEGPRTFEPGEISIVYSPGLASSLSTVLLVGALLLSAAALLLGLYLLWRRREGIGVSGGSTDALDRPGDAAADRTGEESAAAATDGDGATAGIEGPDLELLSDEERVEYILDRNGGRMKQASIVTETGWSNAKVSQLLSSMADDDRIDKLRIGRENLISLPGEGVADFDGGESDDEER